ncbi:unnamed protein product [Phaedon cochleariae]|uniref:RdRp catalytic domain-containing protein n=1 Tax=Phaedon cochleariae TaxID=80249 RepID=A0A9N9X463_PHACE|nr:unnamed protein product [Phaedon cochleariae]
MYQRPESVNSIARDIDNLFGFDWVYQDSHIWMQRCFVLNNSRVNPPKMAQSGLPTPGFCCHVNQKGGFEGMRQKLWTIGTFCTILTVAYELGIRVSVLGQGDNQVIVTSYTEAQREQKLRMRAQFLHRLEQAFGEQGLILKLSETWISTRLLEYGKKRWFLGAPVPSGTKRATRIISEEGDGVPTFEVALGMLATSTENISASDTSPDAAFILYVAEVVSLLCRRNIVLVSTPVHVVVAICCWPNILGGLILSTLPNHTIRGFDDALTIWLSIYRTISQHCPSVWQVLQYLIPLKNKPLRDYTRLVEDIFSLNIPTLQTASLVITDKRDSDEKSTTEFGDTPIIYSIRALYLSDGSEN